MGITRKADIIDAIVERALAAIAAELEVKESEAADSLETTVETKAKSTLNKELSACKKFSEVLKFTKDNQLDEDDFYELVEPTMAGLERKGLLHMVSQYCEAHDLLLDTKKPYENRLYELFDELVPSSSAADSLAGELVRAVSRIGHRYYNDGDLLGVGYGRETVNPVGRFLRKYGNKNIADCIKAIWTDITELDYERHLSRLVFHVVNYIEANPKFKYFKTENIGDCRDPEQDFDDDECDYDAEHSNILTSSSGFILPIRKRRRKSWFKLGILESKQT